jgi:hypothetical protein
LPPRHSSFSILQNNVDPVLYAHPLMGGDDSVRATPVPIPNTEVKSHYADGTAGATLWESR